MNDSTMNGCNRTSNECLGSRVANESFKSQIDRTAFSNVLYGHQDHMIMLCQIFPDGSAAILSARATWSRIKITCVGGHSARGEA